MNEKRAEAIGKAGENQIAKALESIPGVYVLRNLYIPGSRGKSSTEIDVLAVTKKGLLVIESKAWTGWIRGSERLNDWSVKIWPGAKPEKRYSPIKQNATHIYALSRYLKLPDDRRPHSVIVFTSSQAELKRVPENTGDYTIIKGTAALQKFVTRRLKVRRDIFTDRELKAIIDKLESAAAKPTRKLRKAHVNYAKRAESKRLEAKEKRRLADKRRRKAAKKRKRRLSLFALESLFLRL